MAIYIQDANGNYIPTPSIIGSPGTSAVMRVSDGYIQWKNDDVDWQNLIALSALKGDNGEDGQEISLRITDGTVIQWRLGDGSWQTLFDIAAYATISVDETVETLAPGSDAKVVNIGTEPSMAVLKFSIPKGDRGEQGLPGHTPEKGVDYFTPDEVESVVQEVLNQVPVIVTITEEEYESGTWTAPEGAIVVVLERLE